MYRPVLAILVLASASLASVVPACSSSSNAPPPANDAGGVGPNQPAGQACDPSLANACLPGPPCYSVKCDEYALVCNETFVGCSGPDDGGLVFEASVVDAKVSSSCNSSFDCPHIPSVDGSVPIDFVCAFSAFAGCSATGTCVFPEVPHLPDGAVWTACGCAGDAVPYVTDIQTAAPVASSAPCAPPVVDAGNDAATPEEAGDDAEGGADEGGADAAEDATLDAPSDG